MFNTLLHIRTVFVLVITAGGFRPGVNVLSGFASWAVDCQGVSVPEVFVRGLMPVNPFQHVFRFKHQLLNLGIFTTDVK